MQNSGGFGGSRSEFLPGEGYDDSDIKYQRYGGCFVSHKKGLVYVLLTVCAIIVASGLVYFYAPRFKDRQHHGVVTDTDTQELIELLTAPPILPHIDKKRQDLQNIITPTHYKLFIKPHLDNEKDKNFTFEGNVTIEFYVSKSTKIIVLNTRKLKITSPVIVHKTNSSRTNELKTESIVHKFLRVRRKREDTPEKTEEKPKDETKPEDSGVKPEESKPEDKKEEETKPSDPPVEKTDEKEDKPEKPAEPPAEKPVEDKPIEEKPAGDTPADKPPEEKPVETPPAEKPAVDTSPEKPPQEPPKQEPKPEEKKPENPSEEKPEDKPTEKPKEPEPKPKEEPKETAKKEETPEKTDEKNTIDKKPENVETSPKPTEEPKKETTTPKPTTKPPPSIEVHSAEMVIGAKKQKMDPYNEYFQIELESALKEGNNYSLHIKFHGSLIDNEGLTRTNYMDDKGKISWNVISKFYPNFARYVFPCFDEPHHKTTFQINVGRKTNKMSLSNMKIKESIPDPANNGWIWDEYETTPKLSTQSAAFVVYDLVMKKIPVDRGVVINMWGRQSILDAATYTLDVFPKLLNYYNQLLGYFYPSSKIDLIAVPNFYTDVSESFGLLSFEESIIVVNADSPNIDKETVLKNIAHGFSKQWFGNIITVKNEDKIWFLEGMSMYMQYLGIDSIEPNWKKTNDLVLITQEVVNSDIDVQLSNYRFDSSDAELQNIYKKKACSIIRMLNNTLTGKVFNDNVKKMIEIWKHDTVTSEYFSKEFLKSENDTISKEIETETFLKNWANQYGLPIITIERDYETKHVMIKQTASNNKDLTWLVPLTYTSSNGETDMLWLKQSSFKTENFKELSSDKWILFNIDQTTLCRINYDNKNWELLGAQLKENPDVISPLSRAQLIDDAFYFARIGSLPYNVILNFMSYMGEKERHHIPWKVFMRNIEEFDIILSRTAYYGYFQDYILNILKKIYPEYVPKEDSTYEVNELRNLVMNWACKLNQKSCREWIYGKYQTWANFTNPENTNPVDYGLRGTMYCTGVENRGKSAWDFLWKTFKSENIKESDKRALIQGMGCAQTTWLLLRYFEKTFNTTDLPQKYVVNAWNSFKTTSAKREAFYFIQENLNRIMMKYLDEDEVMRAIIIGYLSTLSSKKELEEVTKIYFDNKDEMKPYANYLAHAAKKIQSRVNWKHKYMKTFIDIIKNSL